LYILQRTASFYADLDDIDETRRANIHIVITDPNGNQIYMDDGEKLLWFDPLINGQRFLYHTFVTISNELREGTIPLSFLNGDKTGKSNGLFAFTFEIEVSL
jgi:hypothetical protein